MRGELIADYIHGYGRFQERFATSRAAAERRGFGLFNPDRFLTTSLDSRLYYEIMQSRGELRINPGQLGTDAFSGDLELVVLYTDSALARAVLRKAVALTAGLQARITLVAVHAVPFPADFHCAASTHTFLVKQLTDLAADCPLPVNPQVVLARSREEGFR